LEALRLDQPAAAVYLPPPRSPEQEWPPGTTTLRQCFHDLLDDRPWFDGGGCGRIPFRSVLAWAQAYGLDTAALDRLWQQIQVLDQVWIDHHRARQAEAAAATEEGG
jgi:hypothetical protein